MHDQPSVSELVQAVKNFVDETAAPNLSGHAAFHARVASNVLGTILRDLEARERNDASERKRLQALLDMPDQQDLGALNAELCRRIQARELGVGSSDLMAHLKQTMIAQVEVDQPRYSGLKTAKANTDKD